MGWPVDLSVCYLIEPFGTTAGRTFPHTGDDFARRKVDGKVIAEKPDVLAAHGGTVIAAGWHAQAGWRTVIRYWFGRVGVYGHQAALLVTAGNAVKLGQKIGVLGGTGKTSGPHLHYAEYTDEARALSGIVQHWKTSDGRVLWASVDAWAAASGLARPDYRLAEKASVPVEKLEEIIMSFSEDEKNEVLSILRALDARTEAIRAEQVEEDGIAQNTLRHAAASRAASEAVRDALIGIPEGGRYTAMQHFRESLNAIRKHLGI